MPPLCTRDETIPVEHGRPLRVQGFTAPVTGLGSSLGLSPGVTQAHSGTAIFWEVPPWLDLAIQPKQNRTGQVSSMTETSSGPVQDTPELRQRCAVAVAPFGFSDSTKGEMVDAYLEAPDGFDTVIRDAVTSEAAGKLRTAPANVIVAAIRRGEHLRAQYVSNLGHSPRKTGWRLVYGESHAACTYVEDPEGTDPLPANYDMLTKNPHEPGAWRA